jgi:hypothetical protein
MRNKFLQNIIIMKNIARPNRIRWNRLNIITVTELALTYIEVISQNLCEIVDISYYVIADEQLDENELQKLSKYCQCDCCTGRKKWYEVSTWTTGCLNSHNPLQHQINAARKYKSTMETPCPCKIDVVRAMSEIIF